MHAYDHGVAMNIISAIIRLIQELAELLGRDRDYFIRKLSVRFHSLCSTLEMKHTTLMSFVNQSIVDSLDTFLKSQASSKTRHQPIVDASDVQRLMLAIPFLLDGLASDDLQAFNAGKTPGNRLLDPMPEAIMAVNEWLHWYHMYRLPESGVHIYTYLSISIRIGVYTYISVYIHPYWYIDVRRGTKQCISIYIYPFIVVYTCTYSFIVVYTC